MGHTNDNGSRIELALIPFGTKFIKRKI